MSEQHIIAGTTHMFVCSDCGCACSTIHCKDTASPTQGLCNACFWAKHGAQVKDERFNRPEAWRAPVGMEKVKEELRLVDIKRVPKDPLEKSLDEAVKAVEAAADMVNHPPHYTSHPAGIECIEVVEHFNFNLGNAIKYLWRAALKNGREDLEKARWYVNREIERQQKYS